MKRKSKPQSNEAIPDVIVYCGISKAAADGIPTVMVNQEDGVLVFDSRLPTRIRNARLVIPSSMDKETLNHLQCRLFCLGFQEFEIIRSD